MSAVIHHPKGSMCMSCELFADNCSKFEFKDMRVIKQYSQAGDPTVFKIVLCTEHKHQIGGKDYE